jgi:TonB family protein
MKAKLLLLTTLLFLAGCSLISSPTATVKSFMEAAQKGDVETMTKQFSNSAIQKIGIDKVRSNNQSFADTAQKAAASGGTYRMQDVQEISIPTGKQVSFFYKNEKGTDSIKLVFDLSKEGGDWKIDNIGGAEKEETTNLVTPSPSASVQVEAPPPPPSPASKVSENKKTPFKAGQVETAPSPPVSKVTPPKAPLTSKAPISGGVLNGKAISLPKPAYPPIAKAAKASGTVVVQVVVDERGNVISAHAVSGNPLLQTAAVEAARGAKFSPTKLSGQPVKMTGVITYNFSAP